MHLPPLISRQITEMGFKTIRDAFRAALAGRLYSRKKGGLDLENQVLAQGCRMLGHPVLTRNTIRKFKPGPGEITVGDTIDRLSGRPSSCPPSLLGASIRMLLLPATMHNSVEALGIDTIKGLLNTPLPKIVSGEGIGRPNLGTFLIHLFDFIFILNEDDDSTPCLSDPTVKLQSGPWKVIQDPSLKEFMTEDVARSGHETLDSNRLVSTTMFRTISGGIFQGDGYHHAYLSLAHNLTDPGEPKIASAVCSLCAPYGLRQELCPHLAALALLDSGPKQTSPEILPGLPPEPRLSPWQAIGSILYELFGPGSPIDTVISSDDHGYHLTIPGPGEIPWAHWLLTETTLAEARLLFAEQLNWQCEPPAFPPYREELLTLREVLQQTGTSATEAELNAINKRTPDQDRDASIWFWLTDKQRRTTPLHSLHLEGPDAEGLFSIRASSPEPAQDLFQMTLPRTKMPDLVDALAASGFEDLLLPPARSITRATLDDNGDLILSTMLRMADGRLLERHELEGNRYGRYYYLKDLGFIPVLEQETDQPSSQADYTPNHFQANQVPEFVERYQELLNTPENDIDPELRNLTLREAPDRLEVSSFSSDENWCYLAGQYGLGNRNISLTELLVARLGKNRFMPGGREWLKLTGSPLEWFHNLGEERIWRNEENGENGIRLTRREMMMLSTLVPELRMEDAARGRELLRQLLDTDHWINDERLEGMPPHLRDYQRHGISWLYQIYRNQLAGILADDMGLGKTHQALGLFKAIIAATDRPFRFLVVCPATVVPHWTEKITDFFPELSYYVYHGSRRDLEKAGDCQIYLTTYGIIRRDTEALADMDFDLIIYDEIQQLKNKRTDVFKSAALLKGRVVIGLTGTPLENSVYDLKAIFDICLPGYLNSDHDFRNRFGNPIEEEGSHKHRQALSRLIRPFVLRRTREQVLVELPDVIEDIRTCQLSDDQVGLYRELIAGRGRSILDRLTDTSPDRPVEYMELLAVINYLKQVCDHPCLIKSCTEFSNYKSGKWDLFEELLTECLDASIKVVVFSHYTRMLDIIEDYLDRKGVAHCGLRGNMTMKKRHEMIRTFNKDESCKVFTASLLAGGVGIDLTAAQAVIHYDRWWNAAREEQATARVHRMGQKHVVQVFKLITAGTLEEKIHTLIQKKKDLANELVREDDVGIIKRLNRDELIDLLSVPLA